MRFGVGMIQKGQPSSSGCDLHVKELIVLGMEIGEIAEITQFLSKEKGEMIGAGLSNILTYWILQTVAMAITALLIPNLKVTSIFGAGLTVIVLALINATVWDAALFLSVPDTLSSQAGILFLANGVLFWVVVKLLPGIEVEGVLPALIAPVVFTGLSLAISHFSKSIDWVEVGKLGLGYIEQIKDYTTTAGPPPEQ